MIAELTNLERIIDTIVAMQDDGMDKLDVTAWGAKLLKEKERLNTVFREKITANAHQPHVVERYVAYHKEKLGNMQETSDNWPQEITGRIAGTLDDLSNALDLLALSSMGKTEKAHLNLSVQEFALFCRLIWQRNLIVQQNKASLIRFMVKHFATKNAGQYSDISKDSFKKKMSHSSVSTCDSLHRILKGFLNELEDIRAEAVEEEIKAARGIPQ